jgi:hypothetical protein
MEQVTPPSDYKDYSRGYNDIISGKKYKDYNFLSELPKNTNQI